MTATDYARPPIRRAPVAPLPPPLADEMARWDALVHSVARPTKMQGAAIQRRAIPANEARSRPQKHFPNNQAKRAACIDAIRNNPGLSCRKLAELAGVSASYVSRVRAEMT